MRKYKPQTITIPLKVLICDADSGAGEFLRRAIEITPNILGLKQVNSVDKAKSEFRSGNYNTIFIDPISFGIDEGASLIFEIRKTFPKIVFVLYIDQAYSELNRATFYKGERQRFLHYYVLDKRTPVLSFYDEVSAILKLCAFYLSGSMSISSLERLRSEAATLSNVADPQNSALLEAVHEELSLLIQHQTIGTPTENRSVFLSYRFAEEEYVKGLKRLLEESGFKIITGEASNTYVSRSVIDRIRQASFFICLMTCVEAKTDGTFTTSPWLLEEKGVALAFGKPLVLMVEEGVSDFGGLQGDWQRIHFGPKGFLSAALQAVDQLRSYVGEGDA